MSALRFVAATPEFDDALRHLEAAAGAAYDEFVYRDPEIAEAAKRTLLNAGVGEFSMAHTEVALTSERRVAGSIAHLSARDLRRARTRAAMALHKGGLLTQHPGLVPRIRSAASTLIAVQPDDYYLSRIAVVPECRGRGFGAALVKRVLEAAQEAEAARCVLDVSYDNDAAIRLYERCGFEPLGEGVAEQGGRRLRYVHLGRAIR